MSWGHVETDKEITWVRFFVQDFIWLTCEYYFKCLKSFDLWNFSFSVQPIYLIAYKICLWLNSNFAPISVGNDAAEINHIFFFNIGSLDAFTKRKAFQHSFLMVYIICNYFMFIFNIHVINFIINKGSYRQFGELIGSD